MQLLLTTSSLREQQATVVLFKTGIQGRTIYRVTTQTHTCIQKQIYLFLTVMQCIPDMNVACMAQISPYFILH